MSNDPSRERLEAAEPTWDMRALRSRAQYKPRSLYSLLNRGECLRQSHSPARYGYDFIASPAIFEDSMAIHHTGTIRRIEENISRVFVGKE
ncbi:MAG: hypothetical protein FVQ80_18780, partial [Planctomycetes bacterium]|nr:hypothetical protein [Planctomycetota bacterium]